MISTSQELRDAFPHAVQLIERLKQNNYDFRQITSRYDEISRTISRLESEAEPALFKVLEQLKKQRLKLKDEIAIQLMKLERQT
jgi:uncharacterized protein YdcH (DUF465 family)